MTENLQSFQEKLRTNPNNVEVIKNFLKFLRKNRLQLSDQIVEYGAKLLKSSILSEIEYWDVSEQVVMAALDLHDQNTYKPLLEKITKKFGKTERVTRLLALQMESEGKYHDADSLYNEILLADAANMFAMKRQISIRKELGDFSTAIRMLTDYLKIFMADRDAWAELADLYISQNLLKNATFCFEELILADPQNPSVFSKYAEVYYTLGGYENFKLARKYFAASVAASKGSPNVRALYGMYLSALAVSSSTKAKQDTENAKVLEWAQKQLKSAYDKEKQTTPTQAKVLQAIFTKQ